MTGPDIGRRREIRKVGVWPPGSLLGGLGEAARDGFLALGTPRQLTAGETLIAEGETPAEVFLLLDACVKITARTAGGRSALLGLRVGGDLAGDLAVRDGRPSAVTATAAGHCLMRAVPRQAFLGFLARCPEAASAVQRAAQRASARRRVEFSTLPPLTRLTRVLAELADSYGTSVREGVMIDVDLTQPELAALVGACEPTVHRDLDVLRRGGILGTGYHHLVVHDARRLRRLAGLGGHSWEYEVPA
ncbi:Crp/Fnr family transcriptional regulator [Sphaerisporangium krabiense]|uniref:CRP-like cAMP-binding protein n=1 Tax=Sphaerisporangium krabiense TaxID=763782 RepID=A0A7W8ZB75_9ACTN|nr:Crp/Fnr family transcriptional regulator [Sphaerisporangium krabiense]MBB5630493.1 CRP-like cAMP-binding protein [Sphaerisporangium krabiense]GII62553.1 Crp/Fnr family transcriptional regulator [Sphaerisporangium krabiense]